jgi:hypothetical protein
MMGALVNTELPLDPTFIDDPEEIKTSNSDEAFKVVVPVPVTAPVTATVAGPVNEKLLPDPVSDTEDTPTELAESFKYTL